MNQAMAQYDPENAKAWEIILQRVRELRAEKNTLEIIGKRMGVGKDTVSRWLKEESGGERTTFGAMLRYARSLGISTQELTGETEQSKNPTISEFDRELAKALKRLSEAIHESPKDIASKAFPEMPDGPAFVRDILNGDHPFTPADYFAIAKALDQNPGELLNRVSRWLGEHSKQDDERKAAG